LSENLKQAYANLERYCISLGEMRRSGTSGFSEEEDKLLAFQSINRLNQNIGRTVRESSGNTELIEKMRILQTYVNRLTVALKSDNKQLVSSSLFSIRALIGKIEEGESSRE
jgi:hypothetical protein